jgi:DNA invertase Pin-like site-specific DNA recombinase
MSKESRLGWEAIETAYALKQMICGGVRVFFYLEDLERTLDSPTDKIMLSLTTFADELEREKARQRTYDAMRQKAQAGYVTGGRVFGYDNVDIHGAPDAQGRPRRSHVECGSTRPRPKWSTRSFGSTPKARALLRLRSS